MKRGGRGRFITREEVQERREQVRLLTLEGLTGKAIARRLGITERNVRDDRHALRSAGKLPPYDKNAPRNGPDYSPHTNRSTLLNVFPKPSYAGWVPPAMIRDAQECNARMRARVRS